MGYYYFIPFVPYLPSCILVPILFKNVPRKVQFVICFIVSGFAVGLMGPTELFDLPDRLYLVLLGLFIIGSVVTLAFVPCMPEAIECVIFHYKIVEGVDEHLEGLMHDSIASLYQLIYSTAGLFAPIIGGAMYDTIGY